MVTWLHGYMVTVYRGPFKDKYLLKVVDKYLGFEYYVSYRGLALHTYMNVGCWAGDIRPNRPTLFPSNPEK